jgi:D-serine deaminase-like pyridoxal phosphate-dependent protein
MVEAFEGIDEMRPGNFVFYDLMQYQIGSCERTDIAVMLYCPVVASHPSRGECVIYGGAIHLSKDAITTDRNEISYGEVCRIGVGEFPERIGYLRSVSQEHGVIVIDKGANQPQPGEVLGVIPVHSCLTAQCMGGYYDLSGTYYDHFATSR